MEVTRLGEQQKNSWRNNTYQTTEMFTKMCKSSRSWRESLETQVLAVRNVHSCLYDQISINKMENHSMSMLLPLQNDEKFQWHVACWEQSFQAWQ